MKPSARSILVLLPVLVSVFLFSTVSFAKYEDVTAVVLQDGTVISGKVMEMSPEQIKIVTSDGQVILKKFDDVKHLVKTDARTESGVIEKHQFELGPEIYYFEYKEPGLMKNLGPMYGIFMSYAYHQKWMFQMEGRLSYGKVDYDSEGTGETSGEDNGLFEIRAMGGYDFHPSGTVILTPFAGVAYRYLRNDSSGRTTSTGAKGYLRESNYYYSPIGITVDWRLKNGWSLGAKAEYDYFWDGQQKSFLSDVDSNYSDVSNNQKSGFGLRGSIRIKKEAESGHYYFAEPFMNYWEIENSDIATITYAGALWGWGREPKNKTYEIGLKLGVGF